MPEVFRVAYVDLATPSTEKARQYYRSVLGATEVERVGSTSYFSLGLDHHNLVVSEGSRPALMTIGLQVARGFDLAELAKRLRSIGMSVEIRSDARPGVPTLLQIDDVGGHCFQLISGVAVAGPGFGYSGVAPLKLGHVAILTPESAAVLRFLNEGLGFVTTDWFEELVTFVTCNRDHHVLNVIQAPFATLHHLAFQLASRDHQFRAADLLAQNNIPTLWGPARHTAGHNVASYHYGADNVLIELFCDMDSFEADLGYCEPKPWHSDIPQRPKRWPLAAMSRWETRYEFDFAMVAFGAGAPPDDAG